MGYDTQFYGEFSVMKDGEYTDLTAEQYEILYDFAHERHENDPEAPGIWCQWVPSRPMARVRAKSKSALLRDNPELKTRCR